MHSFIRLYSLFKITVRHRLDRFIFAANGGGDRGRHLRLALEEAGPIFVKFGQLLSTRRDFLDPVLADELQSLQDAVPPFLSPTIEETVRRSLGAPPGELFAELESRPFAAASVAQVHKARLKDGREVVVKVLRPGIEKTIAADIRLLKRFAALLQRHSRLGRRLRPVEVVADYERVILNELDLQVEAANTAQLRRNFADDSRLAVPEVHWDYCRRDILVMERMHGIPVTDIDGLKNAGVPLKQLAETGVDIFFTQVFEHNFFHADMHPGNIFVTAQNKKQELSAQQQPSAQQEPSADKKAPQYIAIDCAIIGSLSRDDQEYLARNLLAVFQRDYRKVAELHIACGWVPPDTPPHEFEAAMRSVCEPIFAKPLGEISFGQLLLQLFRTAARFDMTVQPSLVLLQKTLLNIEGLGRQLYPQLDLWQTALPYLEAWNSRRLSPRTLLSRLQENLPELIEQVPELPRLLADAAAGRSGLLERRLNRLSGALEAARRELQQLRRGQRAALLLALAVLLWFLF